jgi:hypothetical protein
MSHPGSREGRNSTEPPLQSRGFKIHGDDGMMLEDDIVQAIVSVDDQARQWSILQGLVQALHFIKDRLAVPDNPVCAGSVIVIPQMT